MKKLFAVVAIAFLTVLAGCTENVRARQFGGNMTETIPEGTRLINVTWKDANMWVLYYDPQKKACVFKEISVYGKFQGTVTIPNCNPVAVSS